MAYAERNTWAQLIASILGTAVYLVIVVPQLFQKPVDEIDWVWPMVWTILAAIVLSIVVSIGWGIAAGMRDPDEEHTADQRDRDIERFGDRVGQAFAVIGSLVALVLCMVEAPWFWIGNAIFLGFFLSATLGGFARLAAYREGIPQ
ncbi:hypothetical protein JOD63_003288 [Microbacterium terrae]|uniref:Uncharacterized protein n=1 Tax=Microbacterium terrae TaxID=69369 RepID=A0A0M2H9B3_9MICO|nr:hypothetical protein [Microbacterium terrae]KJL42996.1 hypothetical protein RS81_00960 [Microbacterium terrae]MBP1079320.1 hypothetical protein [Microbacterium terrae]GLJ98720.1 hypothetical protein GCM10017594_19170 [Microbacterium terrae]